VQPVAYVDVRGLEELQKRDGNRLLGVLGYGSSDGTSRPELAHAWTGLLTRDAKPRFEVWVSATSVTAEVHDGVACRRNEEVMFGTLCFDVGEHGGFQEQTFARYLKLFELLDRSGYPHLLRIWHYVPQIHLDDDGLERYRRFSVARHEAFLRSGRTIPADAPAASAVGRGGRTLVIAFIAGKQRSTPVENPRQVSAYRYPEQHGPRGPTFARAAYLAWGGVEQLYISGTASIVGHESQHRGEGYAQLEETIRNLSSVRTAAQSAAGMRAWRRWLFKVYLRPGFAIEQVRERLQQSFPGQVDVLLLEAEICRRELLLEIEAIALRAVRDP